MVQVMIDSVFDMFSAFCADDMGQIIVSICVMGACVALFRVLRRGAGG